MLQKFIFYKSGTPSPTRTDMNRSSTDFESVASTNSAIGAFHKDIKIYNIYYKNIEMKDVTFLY